MSPQHRVKRRSILRNNSLQHNLRVVNLSYESVSTYMLNEKERSGIYFDEK